jgi:hypothetical protein
MYENSAAGSGVYTIPLLIYHPLLAVSGSILVPIMKAKIAAAEGREQRGEGGLELGNEQQKQQDEEEQQQQQQQQQGGGNYNPPGGNSNPQQQQQQEVRYIAVSGASE